MTTRRKIFLLSAGFTGLIFVLLTVIYLSAAKLISSGSIKEKINTYLMGKTPGSITYGNSEVHLLPIPEVIFHQVNISITGKAEGSVASLRIYPDLLSLVKGRTGIAKASVETPHFTIKISRDTERPSLKQIEEKVHAAVRYLAATMPGLRVAVRDGKLDITEEDNIAFSFDMIQSRLRVSNKAVDIELNGRSNIWENISIVSSIKADDLKSKGTIRITHLQPDSLISRLSKETAGQIGVSGLDLSAKFEASGLRVINASIDSSAAELALFRGKKRVLMGDTLVSSDIKIGPETVSVRVKQIKVSRPALNLSGLYTLYRNSGVIAVNIGGNSIAVESLRKPALYLGGDIPIVRSIFTIVQGGEIAVLDLQTTGKSLAELGGTTNIRIAGKMRAGVIYVESRDLTFHNVTGDVLISGGILQGSNVGASLGSHRCSGGKLRVGLKGKDAPFHLDIRVKADMEQLPAVLKHKHLMKNEAVLREMDRIHNLRGSAEGRLILGDRLDSIHVKIAVDNMNIMARYEPVPFPLSVTGGRFFFDEKTVKLADSGVNVGGSSFSGLTARLSLTDPYDLEITEGRLSISADEIFPWIMSFEGTRPVLKDVRSVKGVVSVSSLDLRGPLYKPKEWKFHINGEAKELTLDASFLPGRAEEMDGMFAVTQEELSLKKMRSKIIDSQVTVTGSVREFPSDIRIIDFALQGEIGTEVAAWTAGLISLPPELKLRAPFSVRDAVLAVEKDRKTTFSGGLLFGRGAQVSLSVTKTPDSITIHDLTVKDRGRDFSASVLLTGETIDTSFRGTLAPQTLNDIFADGIYSNASLEGAFRTHIVVEHPGQSTAEGKLKGENIPLSWYRDIPLVMRHIELQAKEQAVVIDESELAAGDMTFKVKGTLSRLPEWFDVDMDVSSGGISWETFENMLRSKEDAGRGEKAGFLNDFPLRGTLRLRSAFFRYGKFRWEPLEADVSFDGKTLLVAARKAALCGVSTTGTVGVTGRVIKIDIALSAKERAFEPTIVCLTDEQTDFTGTFQMEARIRGEGKIGEVADWLGGTFTLSAKDGKILKAKSINKTFDLLNESENLKGQFPDLDREIIGYSDLQINGAVRGKRIQIDEGMLDSSHMAIIARGYLDLGNETLDLNALVSPLKTVNRIVRSIPVLGHVIGGSLISVPVRISGNMKDPQVTFLSPAAIASETLGIVERIFKLPITLVEPVFRNGNKEP